MAKIYVLFQQNWISYLKKMSIWSLTYQQSVFKRYHSDKHSQRFYLQDVGKNQLNKTEQWNKITS